MGAAALLVLIAYPRICVWSALTLATAFVGWTFLEVIGTALGLIVGGIVWWLPFLAWDAYRTKPAPSVAGEAPPKVGE